MKHPQILEKTKTYLIGPMEYSCGRQWREDMATFLEGLDITVFDPYKKPYVNAVKEDEETHARMKYLMANNGYDEVAEYFKQVRSFDLSMVDRSDFIIAYINPLVSTFGTIEELSWAVRMKKPVFIVVEGGKQKTPLWIMGMLPHKYIYDSFDQVQDTIFQIDSGFKKLDSDRWRLFKKELR